MSVFGKPLSNEIKLPGLTVDQFIVADFVSLPDGTVAAPSLRFASDPDNGIYRQGADIMGFSKSIDVNNRVLFATDGSASSPSISWRGDPDMGIYRITTNHIGFATGGSLKFDINGLDIRHVLPIANGSGAQNGALIKGGDATVTNATICPHRQAGLVNNTGLGGDGNVLSLISQGEEVLRLNGSSGATPAALWWTTTQTLTGVDQTISIVSPVRIVTANNNGYTGMRMQAGTTTGQAVWIIQPDTTAWTFSSVEATSLVAGSSTDDTLASPGMGLFIWDNTTGRWYCNGIN